MTAKKIAFPQHNSDEEDFICRFSKAKMLVRSFGHILSIYSSSIRAIAAAPSVLKTNDPKLIDEFARTSVQSPIAISPTLSQSFQLAVQELYPKQYKALNERGRPKIKDVIGLLSANEISAILGITYFYKLIAKTVEAAELAKISPLISAYLKNGAIIGAQLGSSFGRGGGITASGLRILGLACLSKADPKAFKTLRRMIDDNGVLDNLDFERNVFGFTHLDVASVLAGELGYGTIAREAFVSYQSPKSQPTNPQAVFWRHTLIEATRLWQEKATADAGTQKKKNSLGSFDSADGYKWLWNQSVSTDILPGLGKAELEILNSTNPLRQDVTITSKDSLKILIIEDEAASSSMLAKLMSPLGNISTCHSAESALELTTAKNSAPFDLIFLDVGLSGMSGLEFLNIFRAHEEKHGISEELSALIFILTADENPQTVMQSFSHGANGYITKPLNKQIIFEELQKFGLEIPR